VRELAGLVSGIDVCLAQPFCDGAFVDAEVLHDLSDCGLLVAVQGDTDDVVAELFRVELWHGVYPSRLACEQARSDVTKPCTSPSSRSGRICHKPIPQKPNHSETNDTRH